MARFPQRHPRGRPRPIRDVERKRLRAQARVAVAETALMRRYYAAAELDERDRSIASVAAEQEIPAYAAQLEEERGSTEVWEVGLYDGYAIVYVPVDSSSTKYDALRWDGGGFEDWTKGTSTYTRFDLAELDPEVLDGMCDPVLDQADGATPSDCYVFIRKPGPPFGGNAWFSAGASDEYGQYFNVEYDKFGVEIPEAQ